MAVAVLGIFTGGRSRRMGGRPKGRLPAPDSGEPLVEKLVRVGREAGLEPVLVGDASAYEDLAEAVPRLDDDPPGEGPLGGLAALLRWAGERTVVAVACDMPWVSAEVVRRLAEDPAAEPVLAARREPGEPWQPLLARYDPKRVRPVLAETLAAGERSFQKLFGRLAVGTLEPDGALARALADWDAPEDVAGDPEHRDD